jgi:ribosomal protein S18 acetylase RimI-like enzyme
MRAKRFFSLVLLRVQRIYFYRRIIRSVRPFIAIKEATEEELQQVYAWLRSGDFKPHTSQGPRATNYLAMNGKRIVGFVQLVCYPPEYYPYVGYWLMGLTVKPLYRGMGIGEDLTRTAIAKATEEKAEEIFLLVSEDNHPAIDCYLKLGFEGHMISALEEQLEAERQSSGRKRVLMRKRISQY